MENNNIERKKEEEEEKKRGKIEGTSIKFSVHKISEGSYSLILQTSGVLSSDPDAGTHLQVRFSIFCQPENIQFFSRSISPHTLKKKIFTPRAL
jgi:hypothetical protein